MADDLVAILDRLGVAKVRLVAHDWGGPVASILMARHPEKSSGSSDSTHSAPGSRQIGP